MITWILQITIGSFLFIFLIHHIILFLKSTLTIPKIKDLVDSPSQKYKNIYAQLSQSQTQGQQGQTQGQQGQTQGQEQVVADSSMKQDLKSFMKKQLNSDSAAKVSDYVSKYDYTAF